MAPGGGPGPGGRGGGRGASWEGKRVKITKGFDKGKVGTVKEESELICRVELDSTHKRVAIKKTDIVELGRPGQTIQRPKDNLFQSAIPSTPMWTPGTPGHDPTATPNPYADPGTPSTPRMNHFDPNTPGTPMHQDWDAGTPATPGGYPASSPYEQAQTPATPAYGYGSNYVNTPGAGLNPTTPGEEGASPYTPATPGGYGYGTTPYGQNMYESGTPQTPQTPGGELIARTPAQGIFNWCLERIEVRVVSGEFIDRQGVVVDKIGSDCKVELQAGTVITIPAEDLDPVAPSKNCNVIILGGELKGQTGKLIGIDGRDGIVKIDVNFDIKIVDMPSLAVYRPAE